MSTAIVLSYLSPAEDIDAFYLSAPGTLARWVGDFESLAIRLQTDYKTKYNGEFEFRSVDVGTSLYALYGDSHIIITRNTLSIKG